MVERGGDRPQPVRKKRARCDPLRLSAQGLRRDGRLPEALQRGRLPEVGPDLLLDQLAGDGLLEGKFGANLVDMAHALDRTLGRHAPFEGELALSPGGNGDRCAKQHTNGELCAALRFSCRERITYHPGTPYMRVYDLDYMYVFDKQSGLRDYRTEIPTGRKKDKPPRQVALSDLNLPAVVLRAYSAVFVFQGSKRDNYRYSIIRDERALGRDAVVIRFEAIPPYKTDYNDWFGSAWVDMETSQLLKVEAMKADQHEEKLRLESDLAGRSTGSDRSAERYIIENILTDFSVEHNGMRFPSRVVIRRSRFEISERKGVRTPREHEMFWIEQNYSDYRFYGVRAYEQIREIVSGGTTQEDQP